MHRLIVALVCAAGVASGQPKTVWSGIYTAQQARRGEPLYSAACGGCHREDGSGYMGLHGEQFIENWREDSLNSLWVRVSRTMPAGAPASLTTGEYLAILSYLLQKNGFPAGNEELSAETIPNIRFQRKDGPEPVPDFALVETVGCLTRDPSGTGGSIGQPSPSEPATLNLPPALI